MKLNLTKSMGMLLLGIWLIVTGLQQILSVGNPTVQALLPLLAIVSGLLIALNR